jgi:hypothetical protein
MNLNVTVYYPIDKPNISAVRLEDQSRARDLCDYDNTTREEAVSVRGPEGPLAPTYSLDNQLTDGGKFVSLTGRPPFLLLFSVTENLKPC